MQDMIRFSGKAPDEFDSGRNVLCLSVVSLSSPSLYQVLRDLFVLRQMRSVH